jgi:hypothetical protein
MAFCTTSLFAINEIALSAVSTLAVALNGIKPGHDSKLMMSAVKWPADDPKIHQKKRVRYQLNSSEPLYPFWGG